MSTTTEPTPLAYGVRDAARILGVPERTIFWLIANGELRSFKIRRRRVVTAAECQRLVKQKMTEAA